MQLSKGENTEQAKKKNTDLHIRFLKITSKLYSI